MAHNLLRGGHKAEHPKHETKHVAESDEEIPEIYFFVNDVLQHYQHKLDIKKYIVAETLNDTTINATVKKINHHKSY